MTKAIRIHTTGGPEVMMYEDVPRPEPGPLEIRLRHEAIGLNYIDVYFRSGLYRGPALPLIIGQEGAGLVTETGAEVTDIKIGDRVAYAGPLGAYAAERVISAERVVPLPSTISTRDAAALMLQGLTAQYLLRRTYKVQQGDWIVIHAAAGGMGLLLCSWARHLGANIIGVVSTEEKAALARANGATHTIVGIQSLPADVKRITAGAMARVVYDSVGRDTFMASLDCLAPLGLMVSFGNASGPVPPFDLSQLSAKGSLFLTRPTLATYTAKRTDLLAAANELFDLVKEGVLKAHINQVYPLADAVLAHQALEARQTTGSTILVP